MTPPDERQHAQAESKESNLPSRLDRRGRTNVPAAIRQALQLDGGVRLTWRVASPDCSPYLWPMTVLLNGIPSDRRFAEATALEALAMSEAQAVLEAAPAHVECCGLSW
jgi:hypothetical protein